MKRRSCLLLASLALAAAAIALSSRGMQAQLAASNPDKPTLAEAARAALQSAQTMDEFGNVDVDALYAWSRRVMDAESQADASNRQRIQNHFARMQSLFDRAEARRQYGAAGGDLYS